MPLKQDSRAQLNLKGAKITSDLLALLKKAAERQGLSVADFVADTMTAEAQRVLKGEASGGAGLPAKPEEVMDRLAAQVTERIAEEVARRTAEQDAKIAGIAGKVDEQAGVFAELRRSLRRGRWR